MADFSIRRISIAEHADLAAQRTAQTGEIERNPHPEGTAEHQVWRVAYERFLLLHTAPNAEGGA